MKLLQLREKLKKNSSIKLVDEDSQTTDDISVAKNLILGAEVIPLDELSDFEFEGSKIALRVVVHCWLHKDSNAGDYLSDCQAKQLTNISFLQRNDLIQWLSGESQVSQFVTTGNELRKKEEENAHLQLSETANDVVLKEILQNEKVLVDHNSSLRGTKLRNFGYLIKEAEIKLVHPLKTTRRFKNNTGVTKMAAPVSRPVPVNDPIILIPSAASSIFTMANIKQFLEDSQYIHPRELPTVKNDLTTAVKKFDKISKPIRFMIVNNTRLFTKPEYWNRVVAIFTTGHDWQFKSYQWSNPVDLFQRCKGYYFHFSGSVIPRNVEQWNVQKIEVDKHKRFKDVEVLRYFWDTMETELLARGYH